MLARGNSDAAIRLRRAKSTTSVTKSQSTRPAILVNSTSTLENAKTAATRAFGAAQALTVKGREGHAARWKSRSEGPGSHFARQRYSPSKTSRKSEPSPQVRVQDGKSGPSSIAETQHCSPVGGERCEIHHKQSKPQTHVQFEELRTTPTAKATPDTRNRTKKQKWEMAFPLADQIHWNPKTSLDYAQNSENPTTIRMTEAQEYTRPDENTPCISSQQEGAQLPTDLKRRMSVASFVPKPMRHRVLGKITNRSKSLGDEADQSENTSFSRIDLNLRQVRKVPSSLKIWKENCKRKMTRNSRPSSSEFTIPVQQVKARRSHHFGSTSLSHASESSKVNSLRNNSRIGDIRPPTPPKHVYLEPRASLLWAQDQVQVQESGRQESFKSSRLTSWADSSGQNTVVRIHATHADPPFPQDPATAPAKSSLFEVNGHALTPRANAFSQESEAPSGEKKDISSQRIYSALVKRISESEISNRSHTPSKPVESSFLATDKAKDLSPIREIRSPTDSPFSDVSIRIVNRADSQDSQAHGYGSTMHYDPRSSIVSPSIYSPLPWTETTNQSSLPSIEYGNNLTGTAVVSPSLPMKSWNLRQKPDLDDSQRPFTSGDWRDWASDELSNLDQFSSKPLHIDLPSAEVNFQSSQVPRDSSRPSIERYAAGHQVMSNDSFDGKSNRHQQNTLRRRTGSSNYISDQQGDINTTFTRYSGNEVADVSQNGENIPPTIEPNSRIGSNDYTPRMTSQSSVKYTPSPLQKENTSLYSHTRPQTSTPEWIPPPPLSEGKTQTNKPTSHHKSSPLRAKDPSPMSDHFLARIRRGPYAQSIASNLSTESLPRRRGASPAEMAQLRVRRTRRRLGVKSGEGMENIVDEFLRQRGSLGDAKNGSATSLPTSEGGGAFL